jgi:hypothetical protein
MSGRGKSDRPIGTEETFEQGPERDLPAEKGPDPGESVLAKQAPDTGPGEGSIWRTLKGHEVGNHGHSQNVFLALFR